MIFTIVMSLTLSIGFASVSAQDEQALMLEKMQTSTGRDKVRLLLSLSENTVKSSVEKALEYSRQAHAITRTEGYRELEIAALENIGFIHLNQADFEEARNFYIQALDLGKKYGIRTYEPDCYNRLGLVYFKKGLLDKALTYYLKSQHASEQAGDRQKLAISWNNIAIIYKRVGNLDLALSYYRRSLEYYLNNNDLARYAGTLNNIAIVCKEMNDKDQALSYYQQSLSIKQQINDKKGAGMLLHNISQFYEDQHDREKSLEYAHRSLDIRQEIEDLWGVASSSERLARLYLDLNDLEKSFFYLDLSLNEARQIDSEPLLLDTYKIASDFFARTGDYSQAYEYATLHYHLKDKLSVEKVTRMQARIETEKKEQENKLLRQNNRIQTLELNRQRMFSALFFSGGFIFLIFLLLVSSRYRLKKKAHVELSTAHDLITREKNKSEKLLLNILPAKVAYELKEYGQSEPQSFDNVTVFFSDIVNFTNQAGTMDPKRLISELNEIFTMFDTIVEKHRCERIKTIGDAYLCVCGMPEPDPDHALNVVRSAIDILTYLDERNKTSEYQWNIRVGIHSGKVVGGIVGKKKYIYDVFGDTINTAARMESYSEPMKINMSEITCHLVSDYIPSLKRPPQDVKGKGPLNMYFVIMNHKLTG